MSSILVNAMGRETRVALVEHGHIAEFYLERKKDKGIVGNIYKGRVTRVLPGMQAAFVDIGQDKAAFLYVSDVYFDPDFSRAAFELTEGEHEDAPDVPDMEEGDHSGEHVHDAERPLGSLDEHLAERPLGSLDDHPAEAAPAAEPSPPAPAPSSPGSAPAAATGSDAPPAAEAAPAPTGAEVVAAAVQEAQARPTGADIVAAAVTEAQAQPPESGQKRAPNEQRHRESRRDEKHHRREEKPRKQAKIEDLLKVGQEVLVQVSKDPIGTKGARLTSHISIPGRHLVFMPTVDHIGISRRIGNEKERRRLRDTVERMRPPGSGFIVRTVAEGVPQEKLEADIRFLIDVWADTLKKNEKRRGAGLMHPDLDLILRTTRDLFSHDVDELIVDDRDEHERVRAFVAAYDPSLAERVKLHDAEEPIFDAYGVEDEIRRALARKVWLKSGGYLIVDQAEALTAIDVNSGRYVGKKSLEETITKINVEAAKEIVYQLRLRNIGGIIICDFIDMEKSQNRDKVFKALQEALGRDKAKTNVLRISELGLVEMTRKRVRESIGRVMHEDCAYCEGSGLVKSASTVAYEIFREVRRSAGAYRDPTLVIQCSAEVSNALQGEERDELRHLMDRYNKSIQVRSQPNFHREQYEIYAKPATGNEQRVASSGEFESVNWGGQKQRAPEGARDGGRERGGGRGDRGGRDRDRGGRGDRDRGGRGGRDRGDREAKGDRGEREGKGDRGGGGGQKNGNGGGQRRDEQGPPPEAPSGAAGSEP
jgi:ribonuclease G